MKKLFILCFLFLFLFGCSNVDSKEQENLKYLNHVEKKVHYFNKNYLDRYVRYKKNHSELSDEDIVTRVNIGLDQAFYSNTKTSNHLNDICILVNKYISVPQDYKPNDLVVMEKYAKKNIYLVKEAYDSFIQMVEKAREAHLNIRAISAYRNVSYQENLYSSYYKNDSREIVDTYSARPGFSEHHTGLCVDLDNVNTGYEYFEYTDEYEWMLNNSYKYGFILRYPKNKENITGYMYESWHFRYVGVKAATYIHKNNITYDEYFVRFVETKKGTML